LPFHLRTGLWGEKQAAEFLRGRGYKVLGTRVRVGLRGEFDVVARDGEVLVFVEVKTRKSETFGRPISSVDRDKQHALSRAAVRYLKKLKQPVCFRFDVVEVVGVEGGTPSSIRHVENAFPLDRRYTLPW
jgi:putative endonuclease